MYHTKEECENWLNTMFVTSEAKKDKDQLCSYSIFTNIPIKQKQIWINKTTSSNKYIDRAVGSMIGMGIGDSFGHPLEFVKVTDIENDFDKRPKFSYKKK
eukprot:882781_1